MPCRRVSANSFSRDDSVDELTGPSLCPSPLVGVRRPFVLVPGNIGLPVASEMPPAAFELLAPLWWLDSMKCQTEPWTAVVYDRGKSNIYDGLASFQRILAQPGVCTRLFSFTKMLHRTRQAS